MSISLAVSLFVAFVPSGLLNSQINNKPIQLYVYTAIRCPSAIKNAKVCLLVRPEFPQIHILYTVSQKMQLYS